MGHESMSFDFPEPEHFVPREVHRARCISEHDTALKDLTENEDGTWSDEEGNIYEYREKGTVNEGYYFLHDKEFHDVLARAREVYSGRDEDYITMMAQQTMAARVKARRYNEKRSMKKKRKK